MVKKQNRKNVNKIMRKIITILVVLLYSVIVQAQVIVPVDKVGEYFSNNKNIPEHIYYKDVNKVLNKYVGTWEGVYKNRTYYFEITKQIKVRSNNFPMTFRDDLLIKFKITDNKSKKVIRNTFNLPNDLLIASSLLRDITATKQIMLYFGGNNKQVNCGSKIIKARR